MHPNRSIIHIRNIIFFCLFFSCSNSEKKERQRLLKEDTEIETITLNHGSFDIQLQVNGIIKAQQQTQLFFKAMGEIDKINITNSSFVKAGQVVAQLDNRQAILGIKQAQDQLKKAGFNLNKLLIEYGGKDLDTNSVNKRYLESIKIQSGYYEALSAVQVAKIQYENTVLTAPYSGIIANLKTKEHNQASISEPFCTILNGDFMAIEAFILESEFSMVNIGQSAKIQPLANLDKSYIGKVYEINPQVDKQGLIGIKVRIQNPDKYLLDGMNARLVIEKKLLNKLVIPKSALVERAGRKVVFTYESNQAKWNYVVVSHENDNFIVISEGLKIGDIVIIKGNINLGHDARVEIKKD